jgi:glyoxylase-like metal-dependent hydrolase (beta-lactamase superfamily II)
MLTTAYLAREVELKYPQTIFAYLPATKNEPNIMKADEFQWITRNGDAGLAFWQAYDPSVKVELSCSALQIGGKLIFIDPIPLVESALEELTSSATPAAVVVTSANHERAAAWYAKRFGIPVYAPAETRPEFEASLPTMQPFEDGEIILDVLRAIALPGGANGETAFYWPGLGGVLIIGDALINLDATGFDFLPDKYCNDARRLRETARKQLHFPLGLRIIAFAHGAPMVTSAKERLDTLIGSKE